MIHDSVEIKELKNLLKNSGSILIMDNGEPSFVVMNYQTYRDLALQEPKKEIQVKDGNGAVMKINPREEELEILERINKEILSLKDEIEKEEKALYLE